MGTNRVSSNLPTFVVVFHLIFSIVAIAFLSYKVYYLDHEVSHKVSYDYLESELASVRGKISLASNVKGSVQTTAPLTTAPSSEMERGGRHRRANRKGSESSTTDQLQAKCVQNLLKHIHVSNNFLCLLLIVGKTEESKRTYNNLSV